VSDRGMGDEGDRRSHIDITKIATTSNAHTAPNFVDKTSCETQSTQCFETKTPAIRCFSFW